MNTNYCHKKRHQLSQCSPSPSQCWSRIDHTAMDHQWRARIEDTRSFWCAAVDSGHCLACAPLCLRLVCGHIGTKSVSHEQLILDDTGQLYLQSELSSRLSLQRNTQNSREHWEHIGESLHPAATATHDSMPYKSHKQWIFLASVALLDARRSSCPPPRGGTYNKTHKFLRHQLTKDLRMSGSSSG